MDAAAHKEAMEIAVKNLAEAKRQSSLGYTEKAAQYATVSTAASTYAMALMTEQDWD